MGTRVAINGFGRIGRHFLRAAIARDSALDVVAVNDPMSAVVLAHLLEYDTTHDRTQDRHRVELAGDALAVGRRSVAVLSSPSPVSLPWARLGVDVVVECSGRFAADGRAGGHLVAGAKTVVVSAPAAAADVTICVGVNEHLLDRDRHRVVAGASGTTHCVAVMASVLHARFGIVTGWMTTVHAFTSDLGPGDPPHDPRRDRAAVHDIVPCPAVAGGDIGEVVPDLAGRLRGVAVRVPVPAGSLTDVTCVVARPATVELVNDAIQEAAAGPLCGVLGYTGAPIVSSDVRGDPRSCVVSGVDTVVHDDQVRTFGWYDNEWGHANRLLDLVELIAGVR